MHNLPSPLGIPSRVFDRIRTLKLVMWDIDGTLYSYANAPGISNYFRNATTNAFREFFGVNVTYEESHESHERTGLGYWDPAIKHGIDPEKIFHAIHEITHPEEILRVEPCSDTLNAFMHAHENTPIQHIAFTHANKKWASEVLKLIGKSSVFSDEDLWTLDRVGMHNGKHATVDGYHIIATHYGVEPHECMIVEDSKHNTPVANEAGLLVAMVTHGMNVEPCDKAHFAVNTPLDVLNLVHMVHKQAAA